MIFSDARPKQKGTHRMNNAIFSVDLESWCDSESIKRMAPNLQPDKCTQRIVEPTLWLLDLLDCTDNKATFFVLGRVAKKVPALIREIASRGHEIASHGYNHTPLYKTNFNDALNDMLLSKNVIEDTIGERIEGYRAPCFSVTSATAWAYNAIRDAGFLYDSSVYPFGLHPDYGIAKAPLTPYYPNDDILEFPLSCANIGGFKFPCSGGAYLRFIPWNLFQMMYKNVLSNNSPYIFYIHPWELDPYMPRSTKFSLSYLRQYSFLHSTREKVEALCSEQKFISFREWKAEHHLVENEIMYESTLAVL